MRYFAQEGLLFLFVLLLSAKVFAKPGDTTWVQAQNDVHLDYFNDFDASVTFPAGTVSYRNCNKHGR